MTGPNIPPEKVDSLIALLPTGRANAIKAGELAVRLGYTSGETGKRMVRAAIAQAIQAGHLICGDDSGHYFPANDEEVQASLRRLRAQNKKGIAREKLILKLVARKFGAKQGALV